MHLYSRCCQNQHSPRLKHVARIPTPHVARYVDVAWCACIDAEFWCRHASSVARCHDNCCHPIHNQRASSVGSTPPPYLLSKMRTVALCLITCPFSVPKGEGFPELPGSSGSGKQHWLVVRRQQYVRYTASEAFRRVGQVLCMTRLRRDPVGKMHGHLSVCLVHTDCYTPPEFSTVHTRPRGGHSHALRQYRKAPVPNTV